MWQGMQALMDYKSRQQADRSDATLKDRLNYYFVRFEASNLIVGARRGLLTPLDQPAFIISPPDTQRTLVSVNTRKSSGS